MSIPFSQLPGRHERHYMRRVDNPLFGERALVRDDESLLEMQRLDHEELLGFLQVLRETVQRAVELKPNEGSEVILTLKEQLDRLYEQSAGLADDHAGNQSAIRELLEIIMRNVELGAAGDAQAAQELSQERAARETHFTLLQHPLVADLLHPDSTILADDLAPSLLSEETESLTAALQMFDLEQMSLLDEQARQCLQACVDAPEEATVRSQQISDRLQALKQQTGLN